MSGFATTYNTKFYNLCHKSKVSWLRPVEMRQFLDQARNVLGWEGGQ